MCGSYSETTLGLGGTHFTQIRFSQGSQISQITRQLRLQERT